MGVGKLVGLVGEEKSEDRRKGGGNRTWWKQFAAVPTSALFEACL